MKVIVQLPEQSNILITANQEVDFTTPLLKKGAVETKVIPISQILGFPPDKIFLNLKKFVGDKVRKGDLLSEYKSFLTAKQYVSEYDGIIKEINFQTGSIVLEIESAQTKTVYCFFKGEVAEVSENKIQLNVKHAKEFEIEAAKYDFGGEICYDDANQKSINEEGIDDKIICVQEIKPFDQVKYETLGANGLILSKELSKPSSIPSVKIKNEDDFKKIQELKLPYCIVTRDNTTITFYE